MIEAASTAAAAMHKAVNSSRDGSSNILKKTREAKAQTSAPLLSARELQQEHQGQFQGHTEASKKRGARPRDSIESPENIQGHKPEKSAYKSFRIDPEGPFREREEDIDEKERTVEKKWAEEREWALEKESAVEKVSAVERE